MGHTNQTANYNLPQFVGTDKPSWLGDINDAFAAIDTAIAAAASEASTADGKADALTTTVSGHTTQIGVLQNTVTTQGNTLNTVTSLIGNGTPTTTDQTIIGAINELHADQGDLDDLQTTDKSSLVAAINEVAQGGGGGGSASLPDYANASAFSAYVDATTSDTTLYTATANCYLALIGYTDTTSSADGIGFKVGNVEPFKVSGIAGNSTTYGRGLLPLKNGDVVKIYKDSGVSTAKAAYQVIPMA